MEDENYIPFEERINQNRAKIAEIRKKFGAPGDWGYETAAGQALFTLYQADLLLLEAIDALNYYLLIIEAQEAAQK